MVAKQYFPTARDLPASHVQTVIDSLLNLVYPERCFICSAPIDRRQDCGVCGECWRKILALKIAPPRCSSCGLPFQSFSDNSEHLCGNCILEPPSYSGARSFGYYTSELSAMVHGLKFKGRRNLVGLLGPVLAETFSENWDRADFDVIVPVPLHAKRKRERGYNQSELLAKSVARILALPCQSILRRTRPTLPQVGLSDSQRQENVRKAFACSSMDPVRGKRVLLVDDVMTTGATVASAAQALMDRGAFRVSVLTVARAAKW